MGKKVESVEDLLISHNECLIELNILIQLVLNILINKEIITHEEAEQYCSKKNKEEIKKQMVEKLK